MKCIPLHGKGLGKFAIIDDCDIGIVNKYRWHLHEFGYAITKPRTGKSKPTLRMHRLILGATTGQQIDHINGNKLDNRRSNLRFSTQAENMRNRTRSSKNTSGYKGVNWSRKDKRWKTQICIDGTYLFLGNYKDKYEAAYIYDQFALQLHGEFARTNLLEEIVYELHSLDRSRYDNSTLCFSMGE